MGTTANSINKVKIKSSDLDNLYEAFDNIETEIGAYVPTQIELKKMVKDLKKYAVFLLYIDDKGEVTDENRDIHEIISEVIHQFIVIDYDK